MNSYKLSFSKTYENENIDKSFVLITELKRLVYLIICYTEWDRIIVLCIDLNLSLLTCYIFYLCSKADTDTTMLGMTL